MGFTDQPSICPHESPPLCICAAPAGAAYQAWRGEVNSFIGGTHLSEKTAGASSVSLRASHVRAGNIRRNSNVSCVRFKYNGVVHCGNEEDKWFFLYFLLMVRLRSELVLKGGLIP